MTERIRLEAADGVGLESELAMPGPAPAAAMVLCHPHPQFGGTMRSIVISALFDAMPRQGVACLRFNFRGVEGSEGGFGGGDAERLDARAAVAALSAAVGAAVPLALVGWSFGADVALSVRDDRLAGWFAIASPLKFTTGTDDVATDPRPKLVALAEHDEYRSPDDVAAELATWTNTIVTVVGGASHFFVGRTDRVVELAAGFVQTLTP